MRARSTRPRITPMKRITATRMLMRSRIRTWTSRASKQPPSAEGHPAARGCCDDPVGVGLAATQAGIDEGAVSAGGRWRPSSTRPAQTPLRWSGDHSTRVVPARCLRLPRSARYHRLSTESAVVGLVPGHRQARAPVVGRVGDPDLRAASAQAGRATGRAQRQPQAIGKPQIGRESSR